MAKRYQPRASAGPEQTQVHKAQVQPSSPDRADLGIEERLVSSGDRQGEQHGSSALRRRLGYARLPQYAALEDADWAFPVSQCRALVAQLATGESVRQHRHCLITGPAGVGKTWLACALAQRVHCDGFRVLYLRAAELFHDLHVASSDGSLARVIRRLTRPRLLVIDEWGAESVRLSQYRAFLELIAERDGKGSMLIVSQLPPDGWHRLVGDPVIADAIIDRIMHNAYHITLDRGPDGGSISCQPTVSQHQSPQT
jgi:DNA replication protein DnaC